MKTNLIGLAVAAATLTSFAAFANDDCDSPNGVAVSVGWNQHEAAPVAPAHRPDGRYELRNSQQWIPDRYEQVTVQRCEEKRHGWKHNRRHHQRCYPVTETRLVPGYYQTVQQWVFVAHPHREQVSQYPGHRPPMYGQGRVGIRFGTR